MFLTSSQASKRIKYIIEDDVDNDIIFVVAHKGIGKNVFLREICAMNPYHSGCIVVDGSRVRGNFSNLKKCFSDGIIEYLLRNNTISNRNAVCRKLSPLLSLPERTRLSINRKIDIRTVGRALCSFSINELKEIYFDLADTTPLVVVSRTMVLTDEEVDYLKSLQNDDLGSIGARITFIIGVRTDPGNLKAVKTIIEKKAQGVWIMPLLPRVTNAGTENDPHSFSSFSMNEFGEIDDPQKFSRVMASSEIYTATLDIAKDVVKNNLNPIQVFILAKQDASLKNYEVIKSITETIYSETPRYDNRIILPNNGKLLWLDVISYYHVLYVGIDKALICTQDFFLRIIDDFLLHHKRYSFGAPTRKELTSFINEIGSTNTNILANGFAHYYSDFAIFVKVFFLKKKRARHYTYNKSISVAEVLGRVALIFSENSISILNDVYGKTQTCYILDIGVEAIKYFVSDAPSGQDVPRNTKEIIRNYLANAFIEAFKWHDLTLAESVVSLFSTIKNSEIDFRVDPVIGFVRLENNDINLDEIMEKYGVRRKC